MSEKVPKIRFKGFEEKWNECKLGDIANKSIEKNKDLMHTETFTNSAQFGIISQRDFFDNDISNKNNINEYYIVERDNFVYNPRISTFAPVGPINRNKLNRDGIVSPLYTVFRTHNINNTFLEYFFKGEKWHKFMKLNGDTGARADRFSIKDDIFFEMNFLKPGLPEQSKIGEYLKILDNLINNHQDKYGKLINIKKSMLEKMFPKEGKNIPEIRFKGFTESWEKYKLDEISSIITKQTGFDYSETIKPSLITIKEEGTYSFIQNKDFNGENINLNTDFYIPISVAKKFPKITIDTPSILISISGKIGNVGYYRLKEKAFIGGAVGICKLLKDNGSLIVYYLQSDAGQAYFNSLIKASSHANITVEDIRKIEVLLPKSFDEEEKISKYFNNLDNLINQNAQQLEKLKNIKKALLEKMFV